jgi:hypothetical protein
VYPVVQLRQVEVVVWQVTQGLAHGRQLAETKTKLELMHAVQVVTEVEQVEHGDRQV